ncbi:hypothetical protein LX36DRAFT_54593 [Colletotrichum falcatum]|nr:hypothetical protein LX36DRAFT_54593 [Colletotrichum falcatum]
MRLLISATLCLPRLHFVSLRHLVHLSSPVDRFSLQGPAGTTLRRWCADVTPARSEKRGLRFKAMDPRGGGRHRKVFNGTTLTVAAGGGVISELAQQGCEISECARPYWTVVDLLSSDARLQPTVVYYHCRYEVFTLCGCGQKRRRLGQSPPPLPNVKARLKDKASQLKTSLSLSLYMRVFPP